MPFARHRLRASRGSARRWTQGSWLYEDNRPDRGAATGRAYVLCIKHGLVPVVGFSYNQMQLGCGCRRDGSTPRLRLHGSQDVVFPHVVPTGKKRWRWLTLSDKSVWSVFS